MKTLLLLACQFLDAKKPAVLATCTKYCRHPLNFIHTVQLPLLLSYPYAHFSGHDKRTGL